MLIYKKVVKTERLINGKVVATLECGHSKKSFGKEWIVVGSAQQCFRCEEKANKAAHDVRLMLKTAASLLRRAFQIGVLERMALMCFRPTMDHCDPNVFVLLNRQQQAKTLRKLCHLIVDGNERADASERSPRQAAKLLKSAPPASRKHNAG